MAEYRSAYTGQEIDDGIAKANTAIQDVSNKQDTLVSGTNIKTINGNSILGEGNLVIEGGGEGLSSVAHDNTLTGAGTNANPLGVDSSKFQSPLVSGTNIKTINNETILGSGNISIEGGNATWGSIEGTLSNQTDLNNALSSKVSNTDYATSSVGGVVKVSEGEHGITVDEGVLKGSVKTVAQYENMSSKGLVAKGTLENVLEDKGYQEELVSGTNIKTINNTSILGSGNIEVGGSSSLPISFSTTQPPTDGSVVLWINADAEEPVVDEYTAFTLAGTCTNLSVEDQTELYSRQYQANATGTNSLYNIIGVKNGSTPINKVELSSIGAGTTGFLVVGCNLNASAEGDLSTLLLYGVGQGQNLGFEIPVRGTTQGQYTNNPTVEGSFSDPTKAYIFESRAITGLAGFKVTATRVDTGELEVTWTWSGLHTTYVPCFGFGRNTSGNINWRFKKVV